MPKSFKKCVWRGYIKGNVAVRSDSEHDELLSRADELSYQLNLENIETASTVNVVHFVSNDGGKYFVELETPISAWTPTGDADHKLGSVTGVNGDRAYATIAFSNASSSAFAELWVCGRTS